jgi:plasmid stability protein
MASLTIRRLDESTKRKLKVRAAHNGRSMEEEARDILRKEVNKPAAVHNDFAERIHKRFAAVGGVELRLPKRDAMREPPDFR